MSAALVRARFRRAPGQPRMRSMTVKVPLEAEQFYLQISRSPEERAVQTFAPDGTIQSFNEWMRERCVRHRLDFRDVEDAQIRLPLAEPIQRIMIRAEVSAGTGLESPD